MNRLFTNELKFAGKLFKELPTLRLLNADGSLVVSNMEVKLSDTILTDAYKVMLKLKTLDKIMYSAQRQGRVSFYMMSSGEEAAQIGSAMALEASDQLFSQYRETGVLIWRGMMLSDMMNQMFSNHLGHGLGRQMPIHYGCKKINLHTISSPLATQLPHAVGSAYAQKLGKEKAISVCYFGEGAASEGDTHAAFNFAACLNAPVLFFCRNNGYAISTPASEQYKGDGIAGRGAAYGIDSIRVDGNDLLAVYEATKEARKRILETNSPLIIEAMTYRIGHHSTSDDSSAYRDPQEVIDWQRDACPVARYRKYLVNKGIWPDDNTQDAKLEEEYYDLVRSEFAKAEKLKKPAITSLFDDVYDKLPQNLISQKRDLLNHLSRNKNNYNLSIYKNEDPN